jgi:hypothetical protein
VVPVLSRAEARALDRTASGQGGVPYDSPAWRELYPAAERHPIVAIFLAVKD